MKFLLVSAVLVGLVAAQSATFPDQMRDFNERFNSFHRETDYFLRSWRMSTSETIERQTRMSLTNIWDSVLELKKLTEVANDKLIYVALEVGNQDPCIVDLFNQLKEVETRAGNEISSCATSMYRQQETAMNSGLFGTIDYTQRSSHFLQIVTLYTLGLHNTVTEQDAIRSELNSMWDERQSIQSEAQIAEGHDHIELSLQTARLNLINCMAVIEGMYAQDSERIYNAAAGCRRR